MTVRRLEMQYHVIFVDVDIANLQRVTLAAENFEAERRIEPFGRGLRLSDREYDLFQARL